MRDRDDTGYEPGLVFWASVCAAGLALGGLLIALDPLGLL
ncbi:hypothetical protein RAZWK3B_16800 [Roseobacter sp. AzwK-3b]|nr:hypothetical protein RAZWK3B_16800 [Roseobacter sp. AzwK-3b]